jgi:hypothetical protein
MDDPRIWITVWIVMAVSFYFAQRKIKKLLKEHDARQAMSNEVEHTIRKEQN